MTKYRFEQNHRNAPGLHLLSSAFSLNITDVESGDMFKNKKLQQAYENWRATYANAEIELTLAGSPIPAEFIAHELRGFGLQLLSCEARILAQSFKLRLLNQHKQHPLEGLKAMLFEPFTAEYVFPDGTGIRILDDDEDMDASDMLEADYPYSFVEARTVSEKLTVTRQQARDIIRFLSRIYHEI